MWCGKKKKKTPSSSSPQQLYKFLSFFLHIVIIFDICTQVCDSDTMLDPASSVEMVKVLEEDPMVGGVGGDVQVSFKSNVMSPNSFSPLVLR